MISNKSLLFRTDRFFLSCVQTGEQQVIGGIIFLHFFGNHWDLSVESGPAGLFGRLLRSDLGLQGRGVVFVAPEGIAAL